jgi:flagellar basal-body rod protein FlgG
MMRSLDIGATGMLAQQLNVDVTSQNIANMTTTGFKRNRPEFKDLMYQNIIRPGATSNDSAGTLVPAGLQLGLGVKTGSVYRVHEQGSLQITSNPLDLALNGDGFFQVELPNGETAYTRDGILQRNQNGDIVTGQGYKVLPGITIPQDATDIQISEDGVVQVKVSGQTTMQTLGQFELANFINPPGLEAIGDNLYKETEASGTPVVDKPQATNFASIKQGAVEGSNVNVVEEITNLITAQRAYEMNSKVISTSDDMLATITQLR